MGRQSNRDQSELGESSESNAAQHRGTHQRKLPTPALDRTARLHRATGRGGGKDLPGLLWTVHRADIPVTILYANEFHLRDDSRGSVI